MSDKDLADVSKTIRDIDFAMLFTRAEQGELTGRPMSNNGDVEYDGDSFFFAWDSSPVVGDIKRDATVALSFVGPQGRSGAPPMFIAVEGDAELIRDKAAFAAHWTEDLDRWFEGGVEAPGLVMIKVHAARIRYWDGDEEGEITPS